MRKLHLLLVALLCAWCTISAETYYYERVTNEAAKDGHYITFVANGCYESSADGISLEHGFISYISEVNGQRKYRGNGFLGNCIYLFSQGYSSLTIRNIGDNSAYEYRRMSAPSSTVALRTEKSKSGTTATAQSSTTVFVPVVPATTTTTTTTTTTPAKTWHSCHSCHGSGQCKYCHGTGLDYTTQTGHCYVCRGTGKCSGCRGEGGSSY